MIYLITKLQIKLKIAILFTFSDIDILETEEYNKTKVNTINPMSKSK